MKKTLYILSALLLGLVSCNKAEFEEIRTAKDVDPTGLVAVTLQVQIPTLQAYTKALGDRSDTPSIKDIRVAVFGTSGYPQTYTLAEPVDASGKPISDYATTNGDTYYFKVLLPVYDGEAHVHIIANGDESIKFVDEDEDSIMTAMKTQGNVGAYWTRLVLEDGILPEADTNGIMRTDEDGNFYPSDETEAAFKGLVLVRNFAEVTLSASDAALADLSAISWTLVNVPTMGSVAPMAAGTWVDDYADYTYDETTGRMVNTNDGKVYDGYMFEDEPMDFTVPEDGAITLGLSGAAFLYERTHPGTDKATCILMKAKFRTDTDFTYYRLDLTNEAVGGYFPIYRNYKYEMTIKKVGNHGAKTIAEAMLRDSGGNVSQSTEARKLTDISDGESRLYVEYVEKNFTSGGKKGLWVQYVPDVTTGTVNNANVTVTIKDQGTALIEGATIAKTAASSDTGYYFYEFELNDQDDNKDLVSVLEVTAHNGKTGDDKSTLYRDVTLRVMKKMEMKLSLNPKKVDSQGDATVLSIELPTGLPESMFPLEFKIEDINHSLYATGKDGNDNSIIVPVKTDVSLVDGKTNSFYFIRTVNYDDYDPAKGGSNIVTTVFKTNKDASATTIYVANEYFKMQSTNLLNDGMYVNPLKTTVPFNTTSVEVQVEFAEPTGKSWTVAAGSGITSITDSEGTAISGGTGNGTFLLNFPANNSATATVTRTATVNYNGTPHTVTITQSPLEFSITPATQTINSYVLTATVTVHAEEGMAWTAVVSGPNGTNPTLADADEEGKVSGEGTATLTVTLPANTTNNQRQFTVTATMTDPSATATATITQRRTPTGTGSFNRAALTPLSGGASTAQSADDGYLTVSLNSCSLPGNSTTYIRMNVGNTAGSITIAPVAGMKITSVAITFNNTTSRGRVNGPTGWTVSNDGNTRTWTGSSTGPVTFTATQGGNNAPQFSTIVVTYSPE